MEFHKTVTLQDFVYSALNLISRLNNFGSTSMQQHSSKQMYHNKNLLKIRIKQVFCFAVKFEQLQTGIQKTSLQVIPHYLLKIFTDFCFFSDLLSQNSGLTIAILDALSNLCLRPDLLAEVRLIQIVFQTLYGQASKQCRQWNLRIHFYVVN